MKNLEIAQIFREVAKILEIKGDNPFRIRAHERAAQNIEGLTEDFRQRNYGTVIFLAGVLSVLSRGRSFCPSVAKFRSPAVPRSHRVSI